MKVDEMQAQILNETVQPARLFRLKQVSPPESQALQYQSKHAVPADRREKMGTMHKIRDKHIHEHAQTAALLSAAFNKINIIVH
jgi:hypothetical protein